MAAHATAPLALCEVVAELCLGDTGPPTILLRARDPLPLAIHSVPDANAIDQGARAKGKMGTAVGVDVEIMQIGVLTRSEVGASEQFPALTLARLRRARLLFKLGPT